MNSDVSFSMVSTMMIQNNHAVVRGDVLDIGCGGKPYKRLFHDPMNDVYAEGVTAWTGLDMRPVGEIVADVCAIPLEDATFDTVLCVDTLSYVFDLQAAFSEMVRVLKPGGRLFVIEPNTREDDSSAFWGLRMKALGALAESNELTIGTLQCGGRLWAGEFENFRGQVKYGFSLPGEFQGFIDAMDEKYPNITLLVAEKP